MRYRKALFRVVLLLGLGIVAGAQTIPPAPKPGPMPAPIVRAKKVFVANLGTDMYSQAFGTKGYDTFYAALESWGHYQLVDDPADADLVFEFGVRAANADNFQRFELTLVDAKTRFPLWSFVEGFDYFKSPHETAEQKFNRHIDHLVGLIRAIYETPTKGPQS